VVEKAQPKESMAKKVTAVRKAVKDDMMASMIDKMKTLTGGIYGA
jgi:hypothetical protein